MRRGWPGCCVLGDGRAPPGAFGLAGGEPEEQFEVVAYVGELGGQVARFVHRAGEDEAALEDGEDLVGEGGQVDGDGGRMQSGGGFELSSSRSRQSRMESAIRSSEPSPASWRS